MRLVHITFCSHFGIILIILGLMSIVGLVLFVSLNRWTQSEK